MIVGVTGTEKGGTQRQKDALRQLFIWLQPSKLRHGDCVGVDAEAHDIFKELFQSSPKHCVFIYPPCNPILRAFRFGEYRHHSLPYLQRNKYVAGQVASHPVDLLIALPKEEKEVQRSGTWATVRYARRAGTPVIILLP